MWETILRVCAFIFSKFIWEAFFTGTFLFVAKGIAREVSL